MQLWSRRGRRICRARLLEQLALGGRLVIPVGDEQAQVLVRVTRHASKFEEEQLGDCRFVKLWGKFGWQE